MLYCCSNSQACVKSQVCIALVLGRERGKDPGSSLPDQSSLNGKLLHVQKIQWRLILKKAPSINLWPVYTCTHAHEHTHTHTPRTRRETQDVSVADNGYGSFLPITNKITVEKGKHLHWSALCNYFTWVLICMVNLSWHLGMVVHACDHSCSGGRDRSNSGPGVQEGHDPILKQTSKDTNIRDRVCGDSSRSIWRF